MTLDIAHPRLVAPTIVAALVSAAVGCGSDTVDADKAEAGIERGLSSATAKVAGVSCPEDVEKEEGKMFTCDGELEGGGKAKVTVTQTGKAGDFTYSFKPGTVELADDAVEPVLEETLAASGAAGSQVDCPDTIKVKDGEQVACTATGSGGRQTNLTFTFSSDDGTVDESSVTTSGA
jgi:hypothetical protein